ncbi:hypothetical protein B0H16DRAFT_1459266 [Mycena metata]|uniref:Uncharacterized protein n=1 Tax=Mycena metata TaxID=1033252 RepID=A0AAD7J2N0_9AGAR|nr:hypothetical protein B0H16DRAFT_1459266 [Mycena metata]
MGSRTRRCHEKSIVETRIGCRQTTETKLYPIDDAAVEPARAVQHAHLQRRGITVTAFTQSTVRTQRRRLHPRWRERRRARTPSVGTSTAQVFAYRATPQKRKHTLPARASGHYTPVRPAPKRQNNSSNNTRMSAYYPHPRSSRETTRPRKKKYAPVGVVHALVSLRLRSPAVHPRTVPAEARATAPRVRVRGPGNIPLPALITQQREEKLTKNGRPSSILVLTFLLPPLHSFPPRHLGRRGRPIGPQDAYGGEQTSWISAFSRGALRGGAVRAGACGGEGVSMSLLDEARKKSRVKERGTTNSAEGRESGAGR